MLFARINRANPEKIFVVCLNSSTTTALSNGQAVSWDYVTDGNGYSVMRPVARAVTAGAACAGVVAEAIASGDYGLVQAWGYHSAARVRAKTGADPEMVAGGPLVVNVAGSVYCLESMTTESTVILTYPCGFAYGATAGFTTATIAVHIKAL